MAKKKIHFYTDCPFFAGCENMLTNFWSSSIIREQFEISASYRDSIPYTEALNQRAVIDFPIYPLKFPDLSLTASLLAYLPLFIKRGLLAFKILLLSMPILFYEVWVLRRQFMLLQPDVIHINNGGYPAALSARAAVIAARLSKVPNIVMVVNNMATDYSRPSRWLNYPLDRLVAFSVTKFITGSVAAACQLQKVLRLSKDKVVTIHNGINVRQITETPDQTRNRLGLESFDGVIFGVVAIMESRKGHQVLLNALLKLLQEIENKETLNLKIVFEGDGPLRDDLQDFVINNQLSKHCIFIGNEKNVMNFMALLDVLILPSIGYEDFPNVILEAMALGKPVISSRLAGTPEQVIGSKTGLLVEPHNCEELAIAIKKLYLDEKLRLKMGKAGSTQFQKNFTDEIAVRKYINLYHSLIES